MYQTNRDKAFQRVIATHYFSRVVQIGGYLTAAGRQDLSDRIDKQLSFSSYDRFVVETGYGMMFRALQEFDQTIDLERLSTIILADSMIGSVLRSRDATIDVIHAPASDPGPPYDRDTDYALLVVPDGMRGILKTSRHH